MELTFASYNIHKGVGLDRRRDPERILAVLREIDADVIALQEADRRLGRRETVIPRQMLQDYSPWDAVALNHRPDSLGWHGNALLVRRGIAVAAHGLSGGDLLNVCLNAMEAASVDPDPANWRVTEEMLIGQVRKVQASKRAHSGRDNSNLNLSLN